MKKKVSGIKRKTIRTINSILYFIVPLLIVILIWQLCANLNLLNSNICPTPKNVVAAFFTLLKKGIIQKDIAASFGRIIKGYLEGTALGLIIGIILGLYEKADKATKSLIGIFRPIPVMALVPFFILWLGIGEKSKIALIALGTFWSVMINTTAGIKNVDKKFIEVATLLNKSKFTTITKVILPAAKPFIITGLRLGSSSALACVVVAEMFAASKGIGFRITFAREMAQPDIMFVGVFIICIIGAVIDLVFVGIQSKQK